MVKNQIDGVWLFIYALTWNKTWAEALFLLGNG